MKCKVDGCPSVCAEVCEYCYRRAMSRHDSLLAGKNELARECHELKAENAMLRIFAMQASARIHAQSELLSKKAEA